MESHELTGAACPMTLRIGDEDKEFQASPFSDKDYDELNLWVQSQVVTIARRALNVQLDDEEISSQQYNDEMGIAYVASSGVSLYTPQGSAIISTPQGIARIAWQMLKKRHPDLKYKSLLEPCKSIENQTTVLQTSNKLNASVMKVDSGGDEGSAKND